MPCGIVDDADAELTSCTGEYVIILSSIVYLAHATARTLAPAEVGVTTEGTQIGGVVEPTSKLASVKL